MKKYILRRQVIRIERAEIEAESWIEAKKALNSDDTKFEVISTEDDGSSSIEFAGDV